MIEPPPVLVVMGVAGAGKTTIARAVAARLSWEFLDGDDLHPAANVAKMKRGQPLDDADRASWLALIAGWIDEQASTGHAGVVACSALKRRYREVLAGGRPYVRIVYVEGARELIAERIAVRDHAYFPASLLDSQFEALEPPSPEENPIVVNASQSLEEQVSEVAAALGA
ncbi:MAG TPA: gluconokinase [Caulobacteraceae bacterium]